MPRAFHSDAVAPARPLLLGMEWFLDEPNGLNRYFYDLLRALREYEHLDARAVVLGPANDRPEHVTRGPEARESLPSRLWGYTRAVSAEAPCADVLDGHFALYSAASLLATSVRRRPFVIHFQGPWADESRVAGRESALRISAKRVVEKATYRRADRIVVLSRAFRRLLVERYGVAPWKVDVIPPGVDLEAFRDGSREDARARLELPRDAWIALAVRRLTPRTGIDLLLDAWAQVFGSGGGAVLVIIGDGPLRLELETRVRALGIDATVHFLRRVPDGALADWYRASNICLVPSRSLEGFGLVVLEALATGRPVVATDAGGLREALLELDPGLVVPAGEASALAAALRRAHDEPALLPTARQCRAHAERFSWRVVARRHRALYEAAQRRADRRRLRVVYVDHCARLSGAELALLRLLTSLDGVEAHVILGEDGPLARRLLDAGISCEVLPMPALALRIPRRLIRPTGAAVAPALGAAVYAARLAARLRSLQPDLVHTNSLKASLYGGVAARAAAIPLVWHVRDRLAEDYLPLSAVRLVRAAARFLPSGLIANSRATLGTLPAGSRRPIPTAVVHDAVDVPDPAPHDGRTDGPLTIGMVGRIAPWKGQHVFIEAFAQAFPKGPERAVIVGMPLFGEDAYERELHELVDAHELRARVEFAGFRDDVQAELARLDVLVHASVTPEPFGRVIIEGMASGLPVVASAEGGPLEIIDHGVNGLLAPAGDAEALARELVRLATDAELRSRLGAAARQRAGAFNPDDACALVVDLYRQVLDRRAVRRARYKRGRHEVPVLLGSRSR